MQRFYALLLCGLFALPGLASAQVVNDTLRILTRVNPDPRVDTLFAQAPDWGGQPVGGVTARLVFTTDATGSPRGCAAITNTAEIAGNIAFIERGGCEFGVKGLNAQNAGAIGFIVYNCAVGSAACANTDNNAFVFMGPGAVGSQVTIPGGFMSYNQAVNSGYLDLVATEEVTVTLGQYIEFPSAGEGRPTAAGAGLFLAGENPTRTAARFTVRTAAPEAVSVVAYNMIGQEVAVLYRGTVLGEQAVSLSAAGLPVGSYFVRATGESFQQTQQVSIVR